MLLDMLIEYLDDSIGMLGPSIYSGELNPDARYLLGLELHGDPDPIAVKRELRKLGQVASFKYLLDWPEGIQVYVVMPDEGTTAEQYHKAVKGFSGQALLKKCNHPIFYSVQWDTSAAIEQKFEGLEIRDVLVLLGLVVVLVLTVRINVGG